MEVRTIVRLARALCRLRALRVCHSQQARDAEERHGRGMRWRVRSSCTLCSSTFSCSLISSSYEATFAALSRDEAIREANKKELLTFT